MVGLEKTKAKAGEVSSSARALALEDIHRLHDYCMRELPVAQLRAGIIRYVNLIVRNLRGSLTLIQVAYLLAWLMLLRIDEVVNLRFENIDHVPGERTFPPSTRHTFIFILLG